MRDRVPKWPEKQGSSTSSGGRNGSPRGASSSRSQWESEPASGVIVMESRRQWPSLSRIVATPHHRRVPVGGGRHGFECLGRRRDRLGDRRRIALIGALHCHAHDRAGRHVDGVLQAADYLLVPSRPNTSRNAASKSCRARAPSPLKLEPCMMARVWGFSSASFLKFCEVSGVYGTYSASIPV
jgi:hypothetical protein